ncbi:MAG: hypothetical protein FJ333_10445 [Sphingomonadales bacterium]|nr:hypothetical protein [Sphingomonadales bacterium]
MEPPVLAAPAPAPAFLFLAAPALAQALGSAQALAPTKQKFEKKYVTCQRKIVLKNLLIDWQNLFGKLTTGTGTGMHFDVQY